MALTLESIKAIFEGIITIELDDGVAFVVKKVDEIRDGADYPGFRVAIDADLENAKIPIKVDITTGDEITPKEISYTYSLLLEERSIEVLSYNIETVLAEKFETIITRGTANTRMRDFYDVCILYRLKSDMIDLTVLRDALLRTSNRRGSFDLLQSGDKIIEDVLTSEVMSISWKRYQKKYPYASDISWEQLGDSVKAFWKSIS